MVRLPRQPATILGFARNWAAARLLAFAGLAAAAGAQEAAPATAYERLTTVFAALDHRLPGSDEYALALEAVHRELVAAGLNPRRQTYDTLVPRTTVCNLTVGGKSVSPVHAVNNGLAPPHTGGVLSGPLVMGGNGRLEAFEGLVVEGAVVLLDLEAPGATLAPAFTLGARAVVLMGGENLRSWAAPSFVELGVVPIPTLYVDRRVAEAFGLLAAAGQMASIELAATFETVVGHNLWVELPATEETVFNLGQPEAIILSATLGTYGMVPQFTPDHRRAANAALLAEALCHLADQPRRRTVVAVFFGSHYAAQEGARHFYYAAGGGRGAGTETGVLATRAAMYEQEIRRYRQLIAGCTREDLLESRDDIALEIIVRMREWLVAAVNNINAGQRDLRNDIRYLQRALERTANLSQEARDALRRLGTTAGDVQASERLIAQFEAEVERLTVEKARWNDLRQQITKRLTNREAAAMATQHQVVGEIDRLLRQRLAELEREVGHNASDRELFATFEGKYIIGHFDVDFARDDVPWVLGVIGMLRPFRQESLSLGSFLLHFAELGRVYQQIKDDQWAAPLFEPALRPYYKPSSLCVPGVRMLPTTPGTILGIPGFQMMSVGEALDHDGMPAGAPVSLAGLVPQLAALVDAFGNRPELSLRRPFKAETMEDRLTYTFRGGSTYRGIQVVNFCRASSDVEGPARQGVFAVFGDTGISTPECPPYAFGPINSEGRLFMPMINSAFTRGWWVPIVAIGYTQAGQIDRVGQANGVPTQRMNMFYAHGGGSYSFGFAPDLLGSDLYQPQTVNGRSDAAPKNVFSARAGSLTPYFTDQPIRIKRIGGRGELLLVADEEHPTGIGFPLEAAKMLRLDGVRQGAEDYYVLNESRLRALRERNIVYDSLERVHAEAREHLELAAAARDGLRHALARAHAIAATCLSNRVYGPLRTVTDDLVRAVVVLLLLNIPFAFAMERLICGFTSIYKQVVGFVGFFLATFIVLFFTHPAFSLASAPLIIFLAFVIILLGVITLYIVLGKIKQEIRAIQGLASTVHGRGGDSNTALAAILIGISGMRNRPLKTFLTAVTVTLLTFTILVFGSFTSEYGVVESYLGKGRGDPRIELHTFSYLGLPGELTDAIGELHGDSCHIFRRGGMFMNPTRPSDRGVPPLSPERIFYNPANGQTVAAGALFGLQRQEAQVSEAIAGIVDWRLADGLPHPAIFLSAAMAQELAVQPGDTLLLTGRHFSVAGVIDDEALRAASTIDDTRITPPDFASTIRNMGREQGAGAGERELAEVDVGMFEWFPSSQIAIADLDALEAMYGRHLVHNTFLLLYPKREDVDLEGVARQVATIFQGATHVKSGEGARRMFFTKAVAGSGFGDVLVPLLLGGLIIFSSLMGSIVDREREIFTYSALGLSPPSIGALFFAESAVYSVVGGLGGYLLSQVVAKGLNVAGQMGWFRPPAMNFSSLSSVLTILIVMAVVMLSTIYPAVKAGRSANPGVARKWKMPLPEGDILTFVFPFTVSEPDFKGIVSFIREHFENHADATLGSFAAREVKLFRQTLASGKDSLGIEAEVSLAPFDLGIFQHFRMYSSEFEIKGIDEVVVCMQRVGGTRGSWIRSTRNFADELRQQFLLWRALPIDTVEHYRQQTGRLLAEADE